MTTSTAWLVAAWQSRPDHRPARPPSAVGPPTRTVPATERPARLTGDRGEGVISVAIAVLIMAFLGAAMWVGFQTMWNKTSEKTDQKITEIGEEP